MPEATFFMHCSPHYFFLKISMDLLVKEPEFTGLAKGEL